MMLQSPFTCYRLRSIFLISFVLLLNVVQSWGHGGHSFSGAIAQSFLTPEASRAISLLLPDKFHGKLSEASSWADSIKRQYPWSYTMHFIDAAFKTPDEGYPTMCELDMARDCDNGVCVVTAVANYTQRLILSNDVAGRAAEPDSLLFLIHFIGDLHQPLHNVKKFRGGNDYPVRFSSGNLKDFNGNAYRSMNMHGLWDSALMDKWIRQHYRGNTFLYLDNILKKLKDGQWKDIKEDWLACSEDATDSTRWQNVCPQHWSQETGRLNCETVWVGVDHTTDLGMEYYERNAPVLELQLAKAGYRMASVLNTIFASKPAAAPLLILQDLE